MVRACSLLVFLALMTLWGCGPKYPGADVVLHTQHGDIAIRLYAETPAHAANFLANARAGVYNGVTFHRVVDGFMIQAGDPKTRATNEGIPAVPDTTLPAEILPQLYHKRGVLAAARKGDQQNPDRRSSNLQFYIVTGQTFTASDLDQLEAEIDSRNRERIIYQYQVAPENAWLWVYVAQLQDSLALERLRRTNPDSLRRMEARIGELERQLVAAQNALPGYRFTTAQRETYTTLGGAPVLDGQYTVFGEVVAGMEAADLIGKAQVVGERPVDPVVLQVTVVAPKDKYGPEVLPTGAK